MLNCCLHTTGKHGAGFLNVCILQMEMDIWSGLLVLSMLRNTGTYLSCSSIREVHGLHQICSVARQ